MDGSGAPTSPSTSTDNLVKEAAARAVSDVAPSTVNKPVRILRRALKKRFSESANPGMSCDEAVWRSQLLEHAKGVRHHQTQHQQKQSR